MHRKQREFVAVGLGAVFVLGLCIFGAALRFRITSQALLANPIPPPELFEELIEKSPNSEAAIVAAWNTQKIVHRQAAMRQVSRLFPPAKPLPPQIESIVLKGAVDADMDVREIAFGILNERNHSELASLASIQLKDPDPQVRLIGLNALKRVGSKVGVAMTVRLLDDADPLASPATAAAGGLRGLLPIDQGCIVEKLDENQPAKLAVLLCSLAEVRL